MARKPEPFSLPSSSDFLINARYRVETAAIISRIFKHETEKLWVSVFSEPIVDSLEVLSRETSLTRNSTKVVRDGCEKMEIGFPFLILPQFSFAAAFLSQRRISDLQGQSLDLSKMDLLSPNRLHWCIYAIDSSSSIWYSRQPSVLVSLDSMVRQVLRRKDSNFGYPMLIWP